jgi:hypothetical protein
MTNSTDAKILRQVPNHRVEQAIEFAHRCATFDDLAQRPQWCEPSPAAPGGLFDRVGARLSATYLDVYSVVRGAVRYGWTGAWVSYDELATLTGRSARQCRRAIEALVALQLLQKVPEYCPATEDGPAAKAGYTMQRLRNAYALGAAAKVPRPPRRVWPGKGGGGPPGGRDKSPDKMAKLCPSGAGSAALAAPPSSLSRSIAEDSIDPRTGYHVRRRPRLTLVPDAQQVGALIPAAQQVEPERSGATAPFEAQTRKAEQGTRATPGPASSWPPKLGDVLAELDPATARHARRHLARFKPDDDGDDTA